MSLFETPADARRWGGSLLVVLLLHALPAIVVVLGLKHPQTPAPVVAEPAVLIDLPPPAAPPLPPSERPPGPQQVRMAAERPRPQETPVRTPPVLDPAVVLPFAAPQPPVVQPPTVPQNRIALDTTAPLVHLIPPAPEPSRSAPTWQGLVLGRLEKFKRYPYLAQARGQQGVPYIRFLMDRNGKVISSKLERSSGVADLDDEAVALPRRAQPFPKPPPEVEGDPVELIVPVEFFISRRR